MNMAEIARAMGCPGLQVGQPGEPADALAEMLIGDTPGRPGCAKLSQDRLRGPRISISYPSPDWPVNGGPWQEVAPAG